MSTYGVHRHHPEIMAVLCLNCSLKIKRDTESMTNYVDTSYIYMFHTSY